MKTILYWTLAIVMLAGGFTGGYFLQRRLNPPKVEEAATQAPTPEPLHVWLTPAQVAAADLKAEPLETGSVQPEIGLFGVIQEDPAASFSVRSAAPGTIVAAGKWPDLGQQIADGQVIGEVQPRIMPSDQIALAAQRTALETQVASAQADAHSAAADVEADRSAYERAKKLNADQNVADRVVEEALAKLKADQARQEGADNTLQLAKTALAAAVSKLEPMPLVVVHGGEVVEVSAQPQEVVESGQAILRVARLEHLVAAVNVPLSQVVSTGAAEARIVPLSAPVRASTGTQQGPIIGQRLGLGASADPRTRDNILLFRFALAAPSVAVRPGTPVTAYVKDEGGALSGTLIPATAVVRYQGKAWVYIWGADKDASADPQKPEPRKDFERRELFLDKAAASPDGRYWLYPETSVFKEGEKVVVQGAAALLSVEANTFGGG